MTDHDRLKRIRADLQRAPTVLYLEGVTDPLVFFALLGRPRPKSDIHQDTYVVGLKNKGSGGKEVQTLVEVGQQNGLASAISGGGVFGITDGDGRGFGDLQARFDAPFAGPLFSWKAYCIENLLAKATWPAHWGNAPDWATTLVQYVPYAALNRVHVELRSALETLHIEKFRQPVHGKSLETEANVKIALAADKGLLASRDVESMFVAEAAHVRTAIEGSLDDGHALVNGKWLVRHYARSVTNKSEEQSRSEWCEAVRAVGGLREVRDLWERITGTAP